MSDLSSRGSLKLIKKVDGFGSAAKPPTRGVALGATRASMTTPMIVVSVLFALAFVAALSQGVFIFPGAIVVIWIARGLKPPRVIAITTSDINTYSTTFWASSPRELLSTSPIVPFPASASGNTVTLGGEAIKMSKKEYARLVTLTADASMATQPPIQPPVLVS